MPIPEYVAGLRRMVGDHPLWLSGVTAVIRRDDEVLSGPCRHRRGVEPPTIFPAHGHLIR